MDDDIQNDFLEESEQSNNKKADNLNFFGQGNSDTPAPVDVNFQNYEHQLFEEKPNQNIPVPSQEKPGIFETFTGKFGQENEINQLFKYRNRKAQDNNPLDDNVDPNWSPWDNKDAYIGIHPKNINYVSKATGPKDLIRRANYVKDQQEEEDRLSRGNLFFQMAGGFTGAVASPSSLLMIGSSAKYAKMSTEFLQQMPKMFPGLALASASHEAAMQATNTGGNLHDWAIDTFADMVMGTAFMGVGIGTKHLIDAQKLYNAKGVIQMLNKDIEPRPQVNEKGELVKWKASPMSASVGAAELDRAQQYLDASMAKNALYHIPYLGDKIGYAVGEASSYLAGKVSPLIRSMNSKYPVMRALMSNVADHGIDTVGTEAGRPNEDSFAHMMSMIRGSNTSIKKQYEGLFMQRNGISYNDKIPLHETLAKTQTIIQQKLSPDSVTPEQFGREVQNAIINDAPSDHAAVNEAAKMFNDAINPMYKEWLKLNGYSETIIPPKTSKAYWMRAYHAAYMDTLEGEKHWMSAVPDELAKDDAEIKALNDPVDQAKAQLKQARIDHDKLVNSGQASDAQIKASSDILDDLNRRKIKAMNNLQDNLRENTDLHRHIDDLTALSAKEAKQIKTLTKPVRKLQKAVEQQASIVANLKGKKFFAEAATQKAKTKITAEAKNEKVKEHKALIEKEQKKLDDLRSRLDEANENLKDKIYSGTIDPALIENAEGGRANIKLKDPKNRLKTREVYKTDFDRQQAAKANYDSILNQTSEDNIRNIMGRMLNRPKENPLGKRTLMLRDQFLYDNNFLHPDPAISVMNYRQTLGRKNAIKKVLNRLTTNGTYEELIDTLAKTHKENRLMAKNEKEAKKEGKRFKTASKDLSLIIGKMEGRSNYSQTAREYSAMANAFAVATKLGFLALTMPTDLMTTVYKHGFWPSIRDGLLPMLKTLNGMLAGKDADAIRADAAHAHVAMMDVNMSYSDRNWTGTAQTYDPVKGKLLSGFETLAHYSMNWSGATYVENFIQRFVAQVIQSKIIKGMLDYQAGKLSPEIRKSLLKYGLDPKEWHERIINEWKAASEDGKGDGNGFGGYRSNYWKWQDQEASNRVSSTIMRAVNDTLIRRGLFDAPFAMDNPIINSIFLFKGFTLATLNRLLVPLLQKPDAQKILGTMLMLAAGATQNPLRRIANSQDPHQEDDHMFRNAMRDGNVFSVLSDAYEDVDYMFNGMFSEEGNVTNERYRNRSEMGTFNGPIGGMATDLSHIIGMVGRREWNKQDVKRIATNTPFLWSWQLRRSVNQMIEATGLPKNRNQAAKMKASGA